MRKENILVIVLICIVIAGVMAYQQSGSEKIVIRSADDSGEGDAAAIQGSGSGIGWESLEAGLAQSNCLKTAVRLFSCSVVYLLHQTKKTTLADKDVQAYLNQYFVSAAVDTDQNPEAAGNWQVRGLPTLWFAEADGSRIFSIPGYVDEDKF